MSTATIQIESLARLGTCVLVVGEDDTIRWSSELFKTLTGDCITGRCLDELIGPTNRADVSLVLRRKDDLIVPLRGEWIPLEDGQGRVFVGSPAPETAEEMARLGIGIGHFLENDVWLNLLIKNDEVATTQADSRARIKQLKEDRNRQAEAQVKMANARKAALNLMKDAEDARRKAEHAKEELQRSQKDLVAVSRQAGMAEVATSVLHNVGNVLNSVNVSASVAADKVRRSKITGLAKAVELMNKHADDLAAFVTDDEKGKQLPGYLMKLAERLSDEQTSVLAELGSLTENIDHIKTIISTQQSYASVAGVVEAVSMADLLEDSLKMNKASFDRHAIQVVRDYAEIPAVEVEKQKLLQILINVVRNAKHALVERGGEDLQLTLRIAMDGGDAVRIEVADNGVGIPNESLTKIFSYGFTTKKDGHGFGLHHSALAAKEMGGSLAVHSDGSGKGATFTLELPLQSAEVRR